MSSNVQTVVLLMYIYTLVFLHLLFYAERRLGYEVAYRSNDCHYRGDDNQNPVYNPLRPWNLFAEDLQVEGKWQDDADTETCHRAEQTHDAIKIRNQNGENDKDNNHQYADSRF